ncbi:DoxX family protein [Xylanimonas protaetiae]|uniref:DoxX family protein n=1 Tax=Xylanimonas protaetiae TaxID=2509457 RepID=A0A4P6F7I1_9MICO|nr:DoxX family protein [Xylanimonas protaetiae]QAY70813.1 DoxX family protein [Xylanimonas protaetiae]
MTVAFWIVSALLGLLFLGAGVMKLARSKETLAGSGMAWTEDFSARSIKVVAALEVLGALGVLLPAATGVAVLLSPVAAVCLAVVMVGAVVVHVRRGESFAPALVPLALAVVGAVLGFLHLA